MALAKHICNNHCCIGRYSTFELLLVELAGVIVPHSTANETLRVQIERIADKAGRPSVDACFDCSATPTSPNSEFEIVIATERDNIIEKAQVVFIASWAAEFDLPCAIVTPIV
jgi:hypothetical protein